MSLGDAWLCNNWDCPAHRSCARHFGRSDHYRAMTEEHRLPELRRPGVEKGFDHCEDYERDGFKAWLVDLGNGHQSVQTPPGWMVL